MDHGTINCLQTSDDRRSWMFGRCQCAPIHSCGVWIKTRPTENLVRALEPRCRSTGIDLVQSVVACHMPRVRTRVTSSKFVDRRRWTKLTSVNDNLIKTRTLIKCSLNNIWMSTAHAVALQPCCHADDDDDAELPIVFKFHNTVRDGILLFEYEYAYCQ